MTERHYERFQLYHRITHGILFVSFLGLALTGLPLKFSYADWARPLSVLLGGPGVTRYLHRFCAILLFVVVVLHFVHLFRTLFIEKQRGILWGPDSMIPQPHDAVELFQHVRWFVGLGERPPFGRYTYWERFDYWAVFWGVAIIGSSGLLLWFPGYFSRLFPGWVFNIATVIHSDEALLAVGFIFSIHFINGHFRPSKFPMDRVMFTGSVPENVAGAQLFQASIHAAIPPRINRFRSMLAPEEIRRDSYWSIISVGRAPTGMWTLNAVFFFSIHPEPVRRSGDEPSGGNDSSPTPEHPQREALGLSPVRLRCTQGLPE